MDAAKQAFGKLFESGAKAMQDDHLHQVGVADAADVPNPPSARVIVDAASRGIDEDRHYQTGNKSSDLASGDSIAAGASAIADMVNRGVEEDHAAQVGSAGGAGQSVFAGAAASIEKAIGVATEKYEGIATQAMDKAGAAVDKAEELIGRAAAVVGRGVSEDHRVQVGVDASEVPKLAAAGEQPEVDAGKESS